MTHLPVRRGADTGSPIWSNLRLSSQLLLLLLACNVPVFIAFHIYDIRATRSQIEALEKDTLEILEPLVAGAIEESMVHSNREHIDELLIELRKNRAIESAQLLDAQGRIVDTTGFREAGSSPRKKTASSEPDGVNTTEIPIRSNPSCVRCHGAQKQILGRVRLTTRTTGVRDAILRINAARAAMVIVGFLCLILSVYIVVLRMVRRPMRQILDGMDAVRRGKLDTRLPVAHSREFRRIFAYFNSMVCDIERDRKRIVELHRADIAHMDRLATLGELAAHLAHEVRNPLTGIGSTIQVFIAQEEPGSAKRGILEKILGQLDRMDKTMSSFLRYARMPETVVRAFKIHEPIQRVLPLLLPRLKAQKIELRVDVPESLPEVRGDAGQIEQSFLNLALNAAQAMPDGGTLTVSAGVLNDMIRVEIGDTGNGIKPAELENIFKPFYSTREKGSGLGLSLSRQIIMAHGGVLTLESVPGSGTTVFFTLPCDGGPGAEGSQE